MIVDSLTSLELCSTDLKQQSVIGWDCEGARLGRDGIISIIQFKTSENCYLLDLMSDAKMELLAFVKEVLEDKQVLKVIHDPAQDSDALFHIHNIAVANVHDTQAWHMILEALTQPPSLSTTLEQFGFTVTSRSKHIYIESPDVWLTRPLSKALVERASGDVNYLLDLRMKQISLCSAEQQLRAEAASNQRTALLRDLLKEKVTISQNAAGMAIGRNGENLLKLQREYGAVIQQESAKQQQKVQFGVYGRTMQILRAAVGALLECDEIPKLLDDLKALPGRPVVPNQAMWRRVAKVLTHDRWYSAEDLESVRVAARQSSLLTAKQRATAQTLGPSENDEYE